MGPVVGYGAKREPMVGLGVGFLVGLCVGATVGKLVGVPVGAFVGVFVGSSVGPFVGGLVGALTGSVSPSYQTLMQCSMSESICTRNPSNISCGMLTTFVIPVGFNLGVPTVGQVPSRSSCSSPALVDMLIGCLDLLTLVHKLVLHVVCSVDAVSAIITSLRCNHGFTGLHLLSAFRADLLSFHIDTEET